MRRLVVLVALLAALLGVVHAPTAAADEDGWFDEGIELACEIGPGPAWMLIIDPIADAVSGTDLCEEVGDSAAEVASKAWKSVWDSILGDVIRSLRDSARWAIQKMLTYALAGTSLDLEGTGLFGSDATLAGMLVWLGWVIAAVGMMWQLGRMAVTGQGRHAARAASGWFQNVLLTAVGVGLIALLLRVGDVISYGLAGEVFGDDGEAYERIVATLLPTARNPMLALSVVSVLLLVAALQMALLFLRQAAIPIQCLLLPIAGAGRVGGEVTRQWAPRLITSILVVIAYKPLLVLILCVGFAEFGHAQTLTEWLRGVATLILAILAPGPLMRIFAPLGAEIGGGLAAGGAMGAADALSRYVGRSGGDRGGGRSEPVHVTTPVEHARYVERSMGASGGASRARDAGAGAGRSGSEAVAQSARTEAAAKGTNQTSGGGSAAGAKAAGGTSAAAGGAGGAAGTASAAGPAGVTVQVLDGIHRGAQQAAREVGGSPKGGARDDT